MFMHAVRSYFLLIVTCLIFPAQETATGPNQLTATGIVVALGGRVFRDDDRCRQLLVVRATAGKLKNAYLLVGRNFNCDAADFTNESFKNKTKWRFPLTPRADCHVTYEQIKDMSSMSPTGPSNPTPWMKLVPKNDGEKMPQTQKLLCYEMNGELKPAR